jgi:hypothetical protein
MDYQTLIPVADTIPAPSWVFIVLEQLLFLLHIILVNAVLGGALIVLFRRFSGKDDENVTNWHMPVAKKLPVLVALGINMGVPPLLFLQVVYGHLFYSSSVLMAVYWILIIPLLILAYYGTYIHIGKYGTAPVFSRFSLLTAVILILYVGFMLVNNNSLMEEPEKWTAYFDHRGGTILNVNAAFFPRYFHFITASVAMGGLFYALVYYFKKDLKDKEEKIKGALKIFAIATAVQVVVGFWYLLSIPQNLIPQFMGQNMLATIFLMLGILAGIGALVTAFLGKLSPTIIQLLITLVAMIITRFNLRMMYLSDSFQLSQLQLKPQYGVLALFILVLLAGLAAIYYMLKAGFNQKERSAS